MKKLVAALLVAVVVQVACGPGNGSGATASADPSPSFNRGTVIIDTRDGTTLLHVFVAQTEQERERGLMGVRSLEPDEGMVFIFFEPTTGGFWMKDTLIPLSIAFFDVDGKILKILDMKPCPAATKACPIYTPGVSYLGALEVNQGTFDRLGVTEGDTVHVVPGGGGLGM